MLLSAVSVLVVAQSSSEIPERLMNNPVYWTTFQCGAISNRVTVQYVQQKQDWVHCSTGQGCTNLPKIWHPPISLCQQGVMKPVPHEGRTHFRLYCTNLVASSTWRPEFVHQCPRAKLNPEPNGSKALLRFNMLVTS